jgi:hypothetical protein
MLSDVCSVLVYALTEGKDDSPGLVRKFIDGVRGYLAEPFENPARTDGSPDRSKKTLKHRGIVMPIAETV